MTAPRDRERWARLAHETKGRFAGLYLDDGMGPKIAVADLLDAAAATTCDCGKTPEACAATEDCSGQSMPAAAHERERAAVEFAANYRIWQNELSRTPSDETLRTAATYNKTLAFNKFIAADNAYLAASGRGKS